MSAPQPLTGDELATIKARAERAVVWGTVHAMPEDTLRLVVEVERLQALDDDLSAQIHEEGGFIDTIVDQQAEIERLRDEVGFYKATAEMG